MKERNGKEFGFSIEEIMSGTHHFLDGFGPKGMRPFSFKVKWGSHNLKHFINPLRRDQFMKAPFIGTVDMGDFVTGAPCEGCLELCYFSEGKIRYRFKFGNNGKLYEFLGEKRVVRARVGVCWGIRKPGRRAPRGPGESAPRAGRAACEASRAPWTRRSDRAGQLPRGAPRVSRPQWRSATRWQR